jgi:hypothetical protein
MYARPIDMVRYDRPGFDCDELCCDDGKHCHSLTAGPDGEVVAVFHVRRVPYILNISTGQVTQIPADGSPITQSFERKT